MIYSIHLLRGIAALLVAGFHLHEAAAREGYSTFFFNIFAHGEIGVDIFFVISGFVIYLSAEAGRSYSVRGFFEKRFWRIYPVYWAVLSFYIALGVAYYALLGDPSRLPTLKSLVSSYLLLPTSDYIIIIAWTLALEVVFYALFAATYRHQSRNWLFFGVLAGWALVGQWLRLNPIDPASVPLIHPGLLFHTAVAEFLFGALIAYAYTHAAKQERDWMPLQKLALIAGAALLAAALAGSADMAKGAGLSLGREITAGIPAALFIYGVVHYRRTAGKTALVFGDSSYLLYLCHTAVYLILGALLSRGLGINLYASEATMAGALIAATLTAGCLHLWAEKPYQAWYKRRLRKRIK